MRKKFLSALLFGVVLTTATGTLVSCKDYDDDIDNLQEQIDKLATADELKASISDMSAAIAAAKSEAEAKAAAAQATADAAKQGADAAAAKVAELEANGATKAEVEAAQEVANAAKAAADAAGATADAAAAAAAEAAGKITKNAADITALAEKVAALETKVNGMSNAEIEADIKALQTTVKALQDEMSKMGLATDAVTSVSLYVSGNASQNYKSDLDFRRATEKDNKFGPNGEWVFTEGDVKTRIQKILVRVSPTTAKLTKDQISLINSQGAALPYISVESVEQYTGLLTTRAAENNGLWEITLKMDDTKTNDELKAVTEKDKKQILFAVAVNNTTEADRRVVSAYDLTVKAGDADIYNSLTFKVNDTDVADIQNRFGLKPGVTEYKWKKDAATKPVTGDNANVVEDKPGDNRTGESTLRAVVGEEIKISLDQDVKGFYVTLDTEYADHQGTAPSEINAWNYYSYNGVYKKDVNGIMFEGTEGTIVVEDVNNVLSDDIGFRVYAVNYDGTLVDPDGKAFYVTVVKETVKAEPIAGNVTMTKYGENFVGVVTLTAEQKVAGLYEAISATSTSWTISEDADKQKHAFDVKLYKTYTSSTKTLATKDSECNFAVFTINNADAKNFIDGATYTQTIVATSGAESTEVTFQATKVMPTEAPAGYSRKSIAPFNGDVLTVYATNTPDAASTDVWKISENVTATTSFEDATKNYTFVKGYIDIENSLNLGATATDAMHYNVYTLNDDNASIVGNDADGIYVEAAKSTASGVSAFWVNNNKKGNTVVYYDFGNISKRWDDETEAFVNDWEQPVDEFQSYFATWFNAQSWDYLAISNTYSAPTTTNPSATATETFKVNSIYWNGTNEGKFYGESAHNANGTTAKTSVLSEDITPYIKGSNTVFSVFNKDSQNTVNYLKTDYLTKVDNFSIKTNGTEEFFSYDATNNKFVPKPLTGATTGKYPAKLSFDVYDCYGNKQSISLDITVIVE